MEFKLDDKIYWIINLNEGPYTIIQSDQLKADSFHDGTSYIAYLPSKQTTVKIPFDEALSETGPYPRVKLKEQYFTLLKGDGNIWILKMQDGKSAEIPSGHAILTSLEFYFNKGQQIQLATQAGLITITLVQRKRNAKFVGWQISTNVNGVTQSSAKALPEEQLMHSQSMIDQLLIKFREKGGPLKLDQINELIEKSSAARLQKLQEELSRMNLPELQKRASGLGIKAGALEKAKVISLIISKSSKKLSDHGLYEAHFTGAYERVVAEEAAEAKQELPEGWDVEVVMRGVAKDDYVAKDPDDISVRKQDKVVYGRKSERDGFLRGSVVGRLDEVGYFPESIINPAPIHPWADLKENDEKFFYKKVEFQRGRRVRVEQWEHPASSRAQAQDQEKEPESGAVAIALANFEPEQPGDLRLQEGQVVVVTGEEEGAVWLQGYVKGNPSQTGVFPANFVERGGVAEELPVDDSASVSNVGGVGRAKVLNEYMAKETGEITINVGDMVVVTEKAGSTGWLKGYVEGKPDAVGYFPASFVELVSDSASASDAEAAPTPPDGQTVLKVVRARNRELISVFRILHDPYSDEYEYAGYNSEGEEISNKASYFEDVIEDSIKKDSIVKEKKTTGVDRGVGKVLGQPLGREHDNMWKVKWPDGEMSHPAEYLEREYDSEKLRDWQITHHVYKGNIVRFVNDDTLAKVFTETEIEKSKNYGEGETDRELTNYFTGKVVDYKNKGDSLKVKFLSGEKAVTKSGELLSWDMFEAVEGEAEAEWRKWFQAAEEEEMALAAAVTPSDGVKKLRVRVIQDYVAEKDVEGKDVEENLDLKYGDIMIVDEGDIGGWMLGYAEKAPEKSGYFPSDGFVEVIVDDGEVASSAASVSEARVSAADESSAPVSAAAASSASSLEEETSQETFEEVRSKELNPEIIRLRKIIDDLDKLHF